MAKMTTCKHCGAEIAASAKTCPKCGGKNKKPIYKKWWFYLVIVVLAVAVIGGNSGGKSSSKPSDTKTAQTAPDAEKAAEASPDAGSAEDASEAVQEAEAEDAPQYTVYDVTELFDALNSNAMKAQDTFKGEYVEIHGFLGTIDSSGKYFGLAADENNYDYMFQDVQCYIMNDEQKQVLMEKNKGDAIIVRGEITDVGEVLGYSLDLDSIE